MFLAFWYEVENQLASSTGSPVGTMSVSGSYQEAAGFSWCQPWPHPTKRCWLSTVTFPCLLHPCWGWPAGSCGAQWEGHVSTCVLHPDSASPRHQCNCCADSLPAASLLSPPPSPDVLSFLQQDDLWLSCLIRPETSPGSHVGSSLSVWAPCGRWTITVPTAKLSWEAVSICRILPDLGGASCCRKYSDSHPVWSLLGVPSWWSHLSRGFTFVSSFGENISQRYTPPKP